MTTSVPELVGTDIQSLDYFRALSERIVDDNEAFISPTTMGKLVRQWHMNVARPLHRRDGSFAGVIVAGLRPNAVAKFYRMANIGTHGMIAVVGLDQGKLRFAQGPNPIDPGTSIAGSDMYKAMRPTRMVSGSAERRSTAWSGCMVSTASPIAISRSWSRWTARGDARQRTLGR